MNTATINIKTEPKLKAEAQLIAKELGLDLSSIIRAQLKDLVRNRRISFDLSEEPSEYLIQALKESEADRKAGRVKSFTDTNKAVSYLDSLIKK